MIRVGILSFSDGRERVHESLKEYIIACEERIKKSLEETKEVECFSASYIICNNELARTQPIELAAKNPDVVILNVPVFAFPNFSAIAVSLQHVPCLAIAPINGMLPGLGGLQAAVNMVRQVGLQCEKVWGNIEDAKTLTKVLSFIRAAHAAARLKGQVYGVFGGRSIGMGSGTISPDLWMKVFGVDTEHIDQLEIIRRAEIIEEEKVESAFNWLQKNMGSIVYDESKLTESTLKQQIRAYYATKAIINERKLNFVGVKCHYELSEYYFTQCLSAAFFNDPYDWDGPKDPIVYSCEADSDGALTMQIMKLISGKPVLFFDFRHYDGKDKVFTFCNCGAMATWYAAQSEDPLVNLSETTLCPVIPKYAGGGCHVRYIAKAGEMTFARLTRCLDQYKLTMFKGNFKSMPPKKLEETCEAWPHGFVEVGVDPDVLIDRYDNNHVHAIAGDYIEELRKFCEIKGIGCDIIGEGRK
ncbi:L-fucose/L-arabinose isomerase family protein [Cellulosilyticum sp. I15G10I2]|uniref:L-fucose/L-arabinose isomerase family protein n=1 Tax=Cellulosilyticum sp. I15G10I2 TaxID=1892843 RepID=UPI00085BFE4B|nr:hypothetical protein [Cellulosilyticum sp. I15G10I2]